jgi:hypothetical protein
MAHGMTNTRMIKSKMEIKSVSKMEIQDGDSKMEIKMVIQDGSPRWRFKMEIQDGDPRWRSKSKMEIQDGSSKMEIPRWRSKMEIQDGSPRWRFKMEIKFQDEDQLKCISTRWIETRGSFIITKLLSNPYFWRSKSSSVGRCDPGGSRMLKN